MLGFLRRWRRDGDDLTPDQRERLRANLMVATGLMVKENLTLQNEAGFNFAAGKLLQGTHPVTLTAAAITSRIKHGHPGEGKTTCIRCAYEDGVFAAVARWSVTQKT